VNSDATPATNWKPAAISAPVAAFFSADAAIVHGELIGALLDRHRLDHLRRLRADCPRLAAGLMNHDNQSRARPVLAAAFHNGIDAHLLESLRGRDAAHRVVGSVTNVSQGAGITEGDLFDEPPFLAAVKADHMVLAEVHPRLANAHAGLLRELCARSTRSISTLSPFNPAEADFGDTESPLAGIHEFRKER